MRRHSHFLARPGHAVIARAAAALAMSILTGATAGLVLARWPVDRALAA
jgi:hypothetical protein